MSDSIRDRLKSSDEAAVEPAHGEHPTGDAVVDTHVSYHEDLSSDPARAKRAERQVAALFLLSAVGVVGFIVSFYALPWEWSPTDTSFRWYTPALGFFMGLALLGLGAGAVHWAKTLMVDDEAVQERHDLASDPADRAEAARLLKAGFEETGLPRRSMLRNTLLLAGGALALLPIPLFSDLGRYQFKEAAMARTGWKKGSRLLDEMGRPVKLGDLEVGGVKSIFPDVPGGRRMADSAAIIIRMLPEDLKVRESRKDWVVDGHVVYSTICTHLGCPVKLYEQQTHHLFCPCHQSTFDAADRARVLFGPAARGLPQLAITVDDEGFFVAQGDFSEPVGPSDRERKPHYDDEVK